VCEKTGQIVIPIDELKEMGFRLYKKSQYGKLLIDDNQFSKEFDMYMLQSAQTYMLENKITFKENDILESINKCKKMLTGGQNDTTMSTPTSNFKNHLVETTPASSITPNLKQSVTVQNENLDIHDHQFRGFTKKKSPASVICSFDNSLSQDLKKINLVDSARQRNSFNGEDNSIPRSHSPDYPPSEKSNSFVQKLYSPNTSFESKTSPNPNVPLELRKPNSFSHVQLPNSAADSNQKRSLDGADNKEEIKRLEPITLDKTEHNVLVSFVEKPNNYWVQDADHADDLLEIATKIKECVAKQPVVSKYVYNKLYLAQDDGLWCRCRIIKFKPLRVFFVDYGNTAQVQDLKEASEDLNKIPAQAVKILFNTLEYTPTVYENLRIKIKKRHENGSYYVDRIITDVNGSVSPKVDTTSTVNVYFGKPKALCELEHGQRVMVISEVEGKLALRTKECYDKLRQIEKSIGGVTAKPVEEVDKQQLVLCTVKDKLQRGIVSNVQGNSVNIELLDYCETVTVPLTSVNHTTESLSQEPTTYILTPQLKELNDQSGKLIQDLITSRTKATVVLNGDFDLQLGDELLSQKLKPPSQKVKPPSQHSDRVLLSSMKHFKPELGAGEYMLQTYRDAENVTIGSEEELGNHIDVICKTELEDDRPYEPIVGEVCFGIYQDCWSRCVVLRLMNGRYEVQFIDFGNLAFLNLEELRKLSGEEKETPVLGVPCKLVGLPRVENIDVLLKKHVIDGNTYKMNIKKYNGQSYEIEIPDLYDAVQKDV
jgi:hypothetical protein